MPENARKTRWYSTGGPWGTGLLLLGVAVTIQGMGYVFAHDSSSVSPTLAWVGQVIPIPAWGAAWVCAGLYSILRGLTPPQRHRDLMAAVGVISLWAMFYLTHWLVFGFVDGNWSRDWSTALGWGSLAGVLFFLGRCVNPPRRR